MEMESFVSSKLWGDRDGNNYSSWQVEMLTILRMIGLAAFVDGEALPPQNGNDDEGYSEWKRLDEMAKGLVLGALSDEVVQYVVNLDSTRDMWLELENEFLRSELTRKQEKEYSALYKAAMNGDWDTAEVILKQNPSAIRAKLATSKETALHIAVGSGKSLSFVEELVKLSNNFTLAIKDELGCNLLHVAAKTGNHGAAEILVNRLPDLLYVSCYRDEWYPIHIAAEAGHKETLALLLAHTRDDLPINPFDGQSGLLLLIFSINSGFLDIALDLVNKYPYLATKKSPTYGSALKCIALKDTTSTSHAQLNLWESLVHSCIQLEMEYSHQVQSLDDIEGQILDQPLRWKMVQKLHSTLWRIFSQLVPRVRRIHEKKLMHEQALRLVKCICKQMEQLRNEKASNIYTEAILTAAQAGNHEIVEVIVGSFPDAIYAVDASNQGFLHMAVKNRSEKVFNLLYQTTNHRYHYSNKYDSSGNSILHLAAFLAPPHKLNLVSGAALQMQREIQWFKEADKFVSPYIRERRNDAGETPTIIFTEEHKDLKIEGERWMKDTANSCTIAAALIVTVVFAAAITVPGGNQSENGYPMMSKESAFTIFAVSDAISLFTSTTSLLMFLSILTSRYAEEDFLYALPKRLSIGLVTLFLSILFMMAAFSSTVYLVFGRKHAWVLIPAAALTCLPISSFVLLQFPLLIAVISSTYGKGIFGKQSDRPFH